MRVVSPSEGAARPTTATAATSVTASLLVHLLDKVSPFLRRLGTSSNVPKVAAYAPFPGGPAGAAPLVPRSRRGGPPLLFLGPAEAAPGVRKSDDSGPCSPI